MAAKISLGKDEIYKSVRAYLKTLFAPESNISIVVSEQNRVSMPPYPYIVMRIENQRMTKRPETRYLENQNNSIEMASNITLNVQFCGQQAMSMAEIVAGTFATSYASDCFAQISQNVYPLYAQSAIKLPWVDESAQFVEKYTLNLVFEFHTNITLPGQTALELQADLSNGEQITTKSV